MRRLFLLFRFAVVVLLLCTAAAPAFAERRVALVVGNSAYANVPTLSNPRNDAGDMIAKLTAMGFEVVPGLDLDRSGLLNALAKFGRAAEGADVALFFYAGHGLQVNGQNYLVPTDARVEYEAELDLALIPVPLVMQQLSRGSRVNIVLLDACRDNPFSKELTRTLGTRSSSALGRGLSRIQSASGTFIAFATQPDNVAQDGDGRNSPFTQALLANMDKPGLSLSDLMIEVRNAVMHDTNGKQVPWDSSSLTGRFSFRIEGNITINRQPDAPQGAAPPVGNRAIELGVWTAIQQSKDVAAFERFLKDYPDGIFASLARERIAALSAPAAPSAPVAAVPETPVAKVEQIIVPATAVDLRRSSRIEVGGGLAAQYGADVLHNAPPYGLVANAAEWVFVAPRQGRYKLEIEYAAQEKRPVTILINGKTVSTNGLNAVTGGWGVANQAFVAQGVVDLAAGENRIRLQSASVFPHIRTLRFTPEVTRVAALQPGGPVRTERWQTNWGPATLTFSGARITGQYALRNGTIAVDLEDAGRARGLWTQDLADRACETSRNAGPYWGLLDLAFTERSFAGNWDYCDPASLGRQLFGVRLDEPGAVGSPADIGGVWETTWGRMTFNQTGQTAKGQFEVRGGALDGKVAGSVFDGVWTQTTSGQPCKTTKGGRTGWGTLRIYFGDNRMVAEWGYCDGPRRYVNLYGSRPNP